MDQYQAFREYEEQQRQLRASKEQQSLVQKEKEQQQKLEQLRVISQNAYAFKRQEAHIQIPEEELNHIHQLAQELQNSNQRTYEVQYTLSLKHQEDTQIWVGWDSREFRSPDEKDFWDTWKEKGYQDEIPLEPQYPIHRYRVDFADPVRMVIIEIDGRTYHTQRYSFTNDRVRERYLKSAGWDVLRFSHDEVYFDVESQVIAAYDFIHGKGR